MSGRTGFRIGLLSAAHVHAPGYAAALARLPGVTAVLVTDDDDERGRSFAVRHRVTWEPDVDKLGAAVDGFIICAENDRHRWWWERAAAWGRPVLCEKPLAISIEDGREMLRLAQTTGTPLFTALPVRTLAPVATLRTAVRTGELGEILAVFGTNHGYLPPGWFQDPRRSGGGAVMDHGSHVVDLIRWICGREPTEVSAEVGNRLYGRAVDDSGLLLMTLDNGGLATLDPSWSRLPGFPTWGDVTLEVVGTAGRAWLDPLAEHLHLFGADAVTHRYVGYGENMDDLLLKAFLEVVAGRPAPPTLATGADGFVGMAVSLAAYQSAADGRPVSVAQI